MYNSSHQKPPIQPPPPPPAPINTVMYSVGGFLLSLAFTVVWCSSYFFRFLDNGAHLMENLYGLMSAVPTVVLAFLFGLKSVTNESHRRQFQITVWNYTRKTKDTRYMPYILPVHYKLVLSLFVGSFLLPFVGHLFVAFILGMK